MGGVRAVQLSYDPALMIKRLRGGRARHVCTAANHPMLHIKCICISLINGHALTQPKQRLHKSLRLAEAAPAALYACNQ